MLHNTLDAGLYCNIYDQIHLKWNILYIFWFWKKSTKTLLFDGNPRSNDKSVLLKMVLIGNFISEINGNRSQWTDTRSYNILPLQSYIRLNKLKYKYSTAENLLFVWSVCLIRKYFDRAFDRQVRSVSAVEVGGVILVSTTEPVNTLYLPTFGFTNLFKENSD